MDWRLRWLRLGILGFVCLGASVLASHKEVSPGASVDPGWSNSSIFPGRSLRWVGAGEGPAAGLEAVAEPEPVAGPDLVLSAVPKQVLEGVATRYGGGKAWGDSIDFNGGPLGCGGTYSSWDETIAAVGPSRYRTWPCGTTFYICGQAGCAFVYRQDACPGCGPNHLDLSEVALRKVCGPGTCPITIEVWNEHD